MPENLGDQLRELLSKQVRAASDDAVRSGGHVPAEQVEALARLASLVDLYQTALPPPARKRWPVVLALGSTLVIVSVLLFARVSETEVEAELALSEVSFVLPKEQVLTHAMDLSVLGASGLRQIKTLPTAAEKRAQAPSPDEGESALKLTVVSDGKQQGTLALSPLQLPASTQVWLRSIGVPNQYRLSFKGPDTEFRADVHGPVRVGSPGGDEQLNLVEPDVVVMQSGEGEVDLDLTLLNPGKNDFSSQLSAANLSFFQVEESRDQNSTIARQVSAILSGTLNFESLNGLERKIRPGEMIQLESSQLEIRTVRLKDDHIELKLHGLVRGINLGSDENRRSLMPTWLEWLQARHSLSLLWATALYLFSLVAGALSWWRKPS